MKQNINNHQGKKKLQNENIINNAACQNALECLNENYVVTQPPRKARKLNALKKQPNYGL